MLKQCFENIEVANDFPAAFGRLCVETFLKQSELHFFHPAAFGRLCVETMKPDFVEGDMIQPPSGGCVLKLDLLPFDTDQRASRLRAAVC